jgi:hypothetical protein
MPVFISFFFRSSKCVWWVTSFFLTLSLFLVSRSRLAAAAEPSNVRAAVDAVRTGALLLGPTVADPGPRGAAARAQLADSVAVAAAARAAAGAAAGAAGAADSEGAATVAFERAMEAVHAHASDPDNKVSRAA